MSEQTQLLERPVPDHASALQRLVDAVQELSHARDLATVMAIVRHAARELTGADGATFVLRDGDKCYYADEEAIAPLWKGQRFPMSACVSGWAMLNKRAAVIGDIYSDPRVPADAYRPTFVKSLVMVPIRTEAPIGAIGNYWADRIRPDPRAVSLLQALADSTSIALENVQLYADQERRIRERTAELEEANRLLAARNTELSQVQALKDDLVSVIVHDVRNPLAGIGSCLGLIEPREGAAGQETRDLVHLAREGVRKIEELASDLLEVRRLEEGKVLLRREDVSLAEVARQATTTLRATAQLEGVRLQLVAEADPTVSVDPRLVRRSIENLVSNAIKFSPSSGAVEVVVRPFESGVAVEVRDRGPGISPALGARLFQKFGSVDAKNAGNRRSFGLGLFFVKLVTALHGGHVSAQPREGGGTVFRIFLPTGDQPSGL